MSEEFLTQEKYDELKAELDYLRATKRREVAEELEAAKSLGDLSENAEYHQAREAQAMVEDRINKLDSILKVAKIVKHNKSNVVEIGSIVKVKKDGSKDEKEFTLVGSEEADSSKGKISYLSPMGKAMLDKKKGDSFSFTTPAGEMKYKIIAVQ